LNPIIAILVFLCSVADDVMYVFFVQFIMRKKVIPASVLSGLLTGLVSFGVMMYADLHAYVLPNIIGSVLGTPLAMWVDRKYFSRSVEKQMKANCPKCGRICSDITAELNERGIGKVTGFCKVHGRESLSGWDYGDFAPKKVVQQSGKQI